MKKMFFLVVLIAGMVMTTQTAFSQTGVQITVLGQLVAGVLTPAGSTTLCHNTAAGLITGTAPTGGQGNYTYQWERSTNGGGTWSNISGATGANYNPGNLLVNTQFRRRDMDGCGTVITNVISFTVHSPFIAGVVSGGITPICNGGSGGILTSTAGSGGAPGITYQWQRSIDGGVIWNDITGETTLTYVVGPLIESSSFRLAFINTCGIIYSNVITIFVYNVFAAGTVTGGNSPICNNTNSGILTSTAPTGGAPGTTLQWESSTDGITYANVAGQTTLSLILGNLTQSMWYRLRYNNTCGIVYSNVINIVVYDPFVAGTITLVGSATICHNTDPGNITGTVSIGGAPGTTYQWESSTNGGVTWSDLTGEILANYNPGNLTTTTMFRRHNFNFCGTLNTNSITITVHPIFNPGTIGTAQTICHGSTPTQLANVIAPSGGSWAYTYQWQESDDGGLLDPWSNVVGATNATFQPPSLTAGIWYRRIVTDTGGCGTAPSLP